MGYYEDQQKAAAHERMQVRMGTADPNKLTTISGNMAWKAQEASRWKPSPSVWSATTFPTYQNPTYGNNYPAVSNPYTPAGPWQGAPGRPHVPDWTDRAMQRIPKPLLIVLSVIGGVIGLGAGAASGAAAAVLLALMGAGAGLFVIPLAIKLTQLVLRILAVAAVVGVIVFLFWMMAQAGK